MSCYYWSAKTLSWWCCSLLLTWMSVACTASRLQMTWIANELLSSLPSTVESRNIFASRIKDYFSTFGIGDFGCKELQEIITCLVLCWLQLVMACQERICIHAARTAMDLSSYKVYVYRRITIRVQIKPGREKIWNHQQTTKNASGVESNAIRQTLNTSNKTMKHYMDNDKEQCMCIPINGIIKSCPWHLSEGISNPIHERDVW